MVGVGTGLVRTLDSSPKHRSEQSLRRSADYALPSGLHRPLLGMPLVRLQPPDELRRTGEHDREHVDERLAKGQDRQLAEELASAGVARDDWIVHTSMTAPTIEYYLERMGVLHSTAYFPRIVSRNTASEWPTPIDSLHAYVDEALDLRRELEATMPPDGAAWIFALVYALLGTQPVVPMWIYRQDWIAGSRAVLRIPRASWVPIEALPPLEAEDEARVRP